MARQTLTYVRAGDSEPLEITVNATGLSNLDDLDSAVLYARVDGATTNHVDGGTCTVASSANRTLSFDPTGQGPDSGLAFDLDITETTRVRCYVLLTWTDGDETRHPAKEDNTLDLMITPNYE